MSTDLNNDMVKSATHRADDAQSAFPDQDRDFAPDGHPHDPRALDWGQAVDAAAARLEESWIKPDTTGHMLASGLADELAATLCAYGMVASEVKHMHDHADQLSAHPPKLPQ